MVKGNEWDVWYPNGKIVWVKPSAENFVERETEEAKYRQWGYGWRKWVVWAVWRGLGSPEGVFEVEGGKVDGKLVLRELGKGVEPFDVVRTVEETVKEEGKKAEGKEGK
jgi:hypothetical protein